MNVQSIRQAEGSTKLTREVWSAVDQVGTEMADDLFDTLALLEGLAARLQTLMEDDAIGEDEGGMLARVVRVVSARVSASAEVACDLTRRVGSLEPETEGVQA